MTYVSIGSQQQKLLIQTQATSALLKCIDMQKVTKSKREVTVQNGLLSNPMILIIRQLCKYIFEQNLTVSVL